MPATSHHSQSIEITIDTKRQTRQFPQELPQRQSADKVDGSCQFFLKNPREDFLSQSENPIDSLSEVRESPAHGQSPRPAAIASQFALNAQLPCTS